MHYSSPPSPPSPTFHRPFKQIWQLEVQLSFWKWIKRVVSCFPLAKPAHKNGTSVATLALAPKKRPRRRDGSPNGTGRWRVAELNLGISMDVSGCWWRISHRTRAEKNQEVMANIIKLLQSRWLTLWPNISGAGKSNVYTVYIYIYVSIYVFFHFFPGVVWTGWRGTRWDDLLNIG